MFEVIFEHVLSRLTNNVRKQLLGATACRTRSRRHPRHPGQSANNYPEQKKKVQDAVGLDLLVSEPLENNAKPRKGQSVLRTSILVPF